MSKYLIILKVDGLDRYIVGTWPYTSQNKAIAVEWESGGKEYVHWDTDISGSVPDCDPDAVWTDTRTTQEKRKCGYKLEADPLYIEYQGCVEDGDDSEVAKAVWTSVRNAIKSKYPLA